MLDNDDDGEGLSIAAELGQSAPFASGNGFPSCQLRGEVMTHVMWSEPQRQLM
ncbi:hypothetical protein BDIM_21790 [Brevundimonas diminuta ATCC 11568]|nr:hypothetical protein BDIM_21790 [Brevundimonas diminuta ATCC 11568]